MRYGIFNQQGQCLFVAISEDIPNSGVVIPDELNDVPSNRLWLLDNKLVEVERPSDVYIWKNGEWTLDPELYAQRLAAEQAALVEAVNSRAAAIYSEWAKFELEYRARESAALAYQATEFKGEPGIYITSYAEQAHLSNQQAAEAIIAQSAALRAAQEQLAALRMRKFEIERATTIESARTIASDIISAMDQVAAAVSH